MRGLVERLRVSHTGEPMDGAYRCRVCWGDKWPCDAREAADRVVALEDALRDAADELAGAAMTLNHNGSKQNAQWAIQACERARRLLAGADE